MARHSFGQGEYKYFKYPLPDVIQQLRTSLYPQLAPLANQWRERLGTKEPRYPEVCRTLSSNVTAPVKSAQHLCC